MFQKFLGSKGKSYTSIWLCRPLPLSHPGMLLPFPGFYSALKRYVIQSMSVRYVSLAISPWLIPPIGILQMLRRNPCQAGRPLESQEEMIKYNFFDLAALTLNIYSSSQFFPTKAQTHVRSFTIWTNLQFEYHHHLPPPPPKFLSVSESEMSCSFWINGSRPHIQEMAELAEPGLQAGHLSSIVHGL